MTDHIVVFEGNERLIGQTVAITVEEATAFTLFGTVVTEEQLGVSHEGHRQAHRAETSGPSGLRIGLPVI